jgi:hypothetical protein
LLIGVLFIFIAGCLSDHQAFDKNLTITTTISSSALPAVSATNLPVQGNNPENPFILQSEKTVREFADISDKNVTFNGITNESYADFYVFKYGNSSFWVNNVTGRVQSAFWVEPGSKSQREIIDLEQGSRIAESYANKKYPELWNISNKKGIQQKVKTVIDRGMDRSFQYSWQEILYNPDNKTNPHSEIPGVNAVFVEMSPYTGHITHYHELYEQAEPLPDLTSNLTEEQARKYAILYFESTGMIEVRQSELVSGGLHVTIDKENNQRLTWGFALTRKNNGIDEGGVVGIDAYNGSVVWHASLL